MNSQQIPEEFKDIRPYAPDELPAVFDRLLSDEQFMQAVETVMPGTSREQLAAQLSKCPTNTDVQRYFFYPLVKQVLAACSKGIDLKMPEGFESDKPHTFITNHRDIVLDSAFLSYLLVKNGFPTTVEIAIGDNLLVRPWIKELVRVNKSFIVQRSLSMREMLRASQVMSRYMHFAIDQKKENIWIAQREGRAKDSDDRTQDALLKMMVMGGEGSVIERLRNLHLTPMALSYEYDPCDFLKAKEFQQRRDDADFKKSGDDDLRSMKTGIFGQKGRIHFEAAPCIDGWLDTLDPAMPKTDLFPLIAQHIDREIHRCYRLYPGNYVAADELRGTADHAACYTADERAAFLDYIQQRIAMVDLEHPDATFLRERLLTMYANPVFNHETACQ